MKTTGSWVRRLVRMGWITGVAITSTHFVAQADEPVRHHSTRAPLGNSRIVNSMIDDAMRDGTLEANEREMILGQAKRLLSPIQVVDVESRLNTLSKAPVATRVKLGTGVKLVEDDRVELLPSEATTAEASQPAPRPIVRLEGVAIIDEAPAAADDKAGAKPCAAGCCSTSPFDNMYLFAAADAWRGPMDGDLSNNFGGRIGFNAGMPLLEDRRIGGQFGMSYGVYDFHGRDEFAPETEASSLEGQLFITAGVFKHCDLSSSCPDRISWGIVYDCMITDNTTPCTAELNVGQFRGQVGYACDANDEVGVWGSITDGSDDSFSCLGAKHTTRSIDQVSLYWDHVWCATAETRAYVGIAEDPGEFVVGSNAQFPLNNYCALFGGVHYILPSTSGGDPGFRDEIWNVSAGIAFYPGGNAIAKSVCGNCWLPLMPVADNGNFALDLGF